MLIYIYNCRFLDVLPFNFSFSYPMTVPNQYLIYSLITSFLGFPLKYLVLEPDFIHLLLVPSPTLPYLLSVPLPALPASRLGRGGHGGYCVEAAKLLHLLPHIGQLLL